MKNGLPTAMATTNVYHGSSCERQKEVDSIRWDDGRGWATGGVTPECVPFPLCCSGCVAWLRRRSGDGARTRMMPTSDALRYLATRLMCAVHDLRVGDGHALRADARVGASASTRSNVFRRSFDIAEVAMRLRGSGETRLFR